MTPWLTIVGVSLDGTTSFSKRAEIAIQSAVVIVGSTRLLDLLDISHDRRFVWPSPFSLGITWLKSMAGQPVVVLATGDPMHYGVGSTLTSAFKSEEYTVLPAPSSLSLAAARMGWALQDSICLSLHGRPLEKLHTVLAPNAQLLILTRDGSSPAKIIRLLCQTMYSESFVSVLENLGGLNETRYDLRATNTEIRDFAALNIVAVK